MSFNQLSLSEAERLAILSEELGETIQVIGKILRHGYETYSPLDPNKTSNRDLLQKELGDVLCIIEMMIEQEDISNKEIEKYRNSKHETILPYLHHQIKQGEIIRIPLSEEQRKRLSIGKATLGDVF